MAGEISPDTSIGVTYQLPTEISNKDFLVMHLNNNANGGFYPLKLSESSMPFSTSQHKILNQSLSFNTEELIEGEFICDKNLFNDKVMTIQFWLYNGIEDDDTGMTELFSIDSVNIVIRVSYNSIEIMVGPNQYTVSHSLDMSGGWKHFLIGIDEGSHTISLYVDGHFEQDFSNTNITGVFDSFLASDQHNIIFNQTTLNQNIYMQELICTADLLMTDPDGNFVPPNHPIESPYDNIGGIDSNTLLMVHGNGDLSDSSVYGATYTCSNPGNWTSFDHSNFGVGSITPSSTETCMWEMTEPIGSGDFTIEGWYGLPGLSVFGIGDESGSAAIESSTFFTVGDTTSNKFITLRCNESGYLECVFTDNSSTTTVTGNAVTARLDIFYHVALVYSNNNLSVYINGSKALEETNFANNISFKDVFIGEQYSSSDNSITELWIGRISEFRVSNVARWTGNFTPPTSPYSLEINPGLDSNTVNFFPFDQNSTADYGNSTYDNFTVFTSSSFSANYKKFGISSWHGESLQVFSPMNPFTVDFWMYANENNQEIEIIHALSTIFKCTYNNGTFNINTNACSFTSDEFVHIAIVDILSNSTDLISIYVNGVKVVSTTVAANSVMNPTLNITSSMYVNELRVSNCIRYNGDFTPSNDQYYVPLFGIDSDTILMLHGDDFFDASPMHKQLYSEGVTISDETHFPNCKSFYFPGGSKAISIEPSDLGDSDFTIDWWEYPTSTTSYTRFHTIKGTDTGLLLGYNGTLMYCGATNSGWSMFNGVTAFSTTPNEWTHWAFVRYGDTFTTYRNGVQFWTGTNSNAVWYNPAQEWELGAYRNKENPFIGYIQEFRISKVARWTSNFTPPTEPYTARSQEPYGIDEHTLLMVHGDGNLNDSSVYGATYTCSNPGNWTSSDYSKFGTGSIKPSSTETCMWEMTEPIGSGDFTIEGWYRLPGLSVFGIGDESGSAGEYYSFFTIGDAAGLFINLLVSNDDTLLITTNSSEYLNGNFSLIKGQWFHVALVVHNGSIQVYINGDDSAGIPSSSLYVGNISLQNVVIGGAYNSSNANNPISELWPGEIDEFRISNVARWTSNFTPPTRPYSTDSKNHTQLLLPFDNNIADFSGNDHYPSKQENVEYSTDAKFGSNALHTNTSTNIEYNNILNNPSSYTIDFWLKPESGTSGTTQIDYDLLSCTLRYDNAFSIYVNGTIAFSYSAGNFPSSYTHIAFVKDGTTGYVFVNGQLEHTRSNLPVTTSNSDLSIISTGYRVLVDELKISDQAEWTSNFNVPISPYPEINTNTTLVLHMNDISFTDESGYHNGSFANTGVTMAKTSGSLNEEVAYFNGASYLVLNTNDILNLSDHDFTIEFRVKPTSTSLNGGAIAYDVNASGYSLLLMHQGQYLYATSTGNGWDVFNAQIAFSGIVANEWYHWALVRKDNLFYVYRNGVRIWDSGSSATLYPGGQIVIGNQGVSTSNSFNGYMEELVVSNYAKYSGNFTPPTSPYGKESTYNQKGNDSATLLLLHLDENLTDSSKNDRTVTAGLDVLFTKYSRFGSAAQNFSSGNGISIPNIQGLNCTSDNFTIDFWVYITESPGVRQVLVDRRSATGIGGFSLFIETNNYLYLQSTTSGSSWDWSINVSIASYIGMYTHIAVVKNKNTWTLYLNGVQGSTWTGTYTYTTADNDIYIGCGNPNNADTNLTQDHYLHGYIDEFRVSSIARWSSNFTPPTSPYEYFEYSYKNDSDTLLNLHLDNNVIDSSEYNRSVTSNAGFTEISHFGAYAAGGFVAQTGITVPNSDDFNFGTNDFTLECWVNFSSVTAGYQAIIDRRGSGSPDTTGYLLIVETDNTLHFYAADETGTSWAINLNSGSIANLLGVYTHIAVVRYNNVFTMYLNGVSVATTYNELSLNPVSEDMKIGVGSPLITTGITGANFLNGYLDEVRISKVARWTENFAPPIRPYGEDNLLIETPYTEPSFTYGAWTDYYSWTSGYFSYANSTSVSSVSDYTINSITIGSDSITINITINSVDTISRSGSNPGNWTFSSQPNYTIHNLYYDEYVTIYNMQIQTIVTYSQTTNITHSGTFDIEIPLKWADDGKNVVQIEIENTTMSNNRGITHVYNRSTRVLDMPLNIPLYVMIDNEITRAKTIFIKMGNNIVRAKDIKVMYDGTLQ